MNNTQNGIKNMATLIPIDEVPAWDSSMNRNYYDFYAYLDNLNLWHIFGHYQFPKCASLKEVLRSQRVYAKSAIHLGKDNYAVIAIKGITKGYLELARHEKEFYLPCAVLTNKNPSYEEVAEIAKEFFRQDLESVISVDLQQKN